MNRDCLAIVRLLAAGVLAAVTGCSAGNGQLGGDAGSQSNKPPVAMVSVINYAGPDAAGDATAAVRSQAEIIVTGKDSDDPDGPILQYEWAVADAGGTGLATADLLVRDRASVNLTVPRVSAATTLRLRLKVTASDGATDSADAILQVQPAADSDSFLQYPGATSAFGIVVTTGVSRSASSPGATYRVRVERRVKYRPRSDSASAGELSNHCTVQQASWPQPAWTDDSQSWLPEPGFDGTGVDGQYITGEWTQGAGTIGLQPDVIAAIGAPQNPRYFFPIPSLDADDVNRQYRSVVSPDPTRQLKGSDIDDAMVEVRVTVEPTGGSPDAAFVLITEAGEPIRDAAGQVITVSNGGSGAVATISLDAEVLRRGAALESRLTAQAYYCAIDPNGQRLTFADWLVTNGFDPSAANFGADPLDSPGSRPHAIYVNNYDLGFGRDMYMKRTSTGCTGAGDVKNNIAGVVINYPSLESAVRHNGSFIAVAMEYALKDPLGSACDPANRMTTFYAYVPDDDGDADNDGTAEARQGLPAFRRVLSANFDGRGEKYIPGSCTACHGGAPQRLLTGNGTYPNAGDIQATFLPWDPDALLYASDSGAPTRADPSFSKASQDAGLRLTYSRESQAATLREFNRMAYATYPNPAIQNVDGKFPFAHYQGPRQLIEGWYGADLAGTYNGAFVPNSWPATDSSGVSPQDLYRKVLAQNCRACHLQQVQGPAADTASNRPAQFSSWADFVSFATPTSGETQGKLLQHVFATAIMPGSRLTSDRFWLPSSSSPGEQLAAALRTVSGMPAAPLLPGVSNVSSRQALRDIALQGGSCSAGSRPDEVVCPLAQWIAVNAAPVSFIPQQGLTWEVRRLVAGAECTATGLLPLGAVTAANGTSRFALRPGTPGLFCVLVYGDSSLLKTWRIVIPDQSPVLRNAVPPVSVTVGTPVVYSVTTASTSAIDLLSKKGDGELAEHRITEIQGVGRACPFSAVAVVNAGVSVGTLACTVQSGIDTLAFTPAFTQPGTASFTVAIADVNGSRAQPSGFVEGVSTPSPSASLTLSIQYQASITAGTRTYTVPVHTGTGPASVALDVLTGVVPAGTAANWRIRLTGGASRVPATITTTTGLSGAGSLSGTLGSLQNSLSYNRPLRTATLLNTTSRTPQDHVTFAFDLVRVSAGGTPVEEVTGFTGVIQILSTQGVAVPRDIVNGSCGNSCHTAGGLSGGISWAGNGTQVHSTLFTGGTATVCSGPLIDTGNPANSCLFAAAGPTGSNHVSNGRPTLTAQQVADITKWINEGSMEF